MAHFSIHYTTLHYALITLYDITLLTTHTTYYVFTITTLLIDSFNVAHHPFRYDAFSDARVLVDTGLGDEQNRARIQSRLAHGEFKHMCHQLRIPTDIDTYSLMPMPAEGLSIPRSKPYSILAVAEKDPTFFDLAATPYLKGAAQLDDTVNFSRGVNNGRWLGHSGAPAMRTCTQLHTRRGFHTAHTEDTYTLPT